MSRPAIDAASLVTTLNASGALAPGADAAIIAALRADASEHRPPLHLKILSAVGTFLATLFFIAFLVVAGLVTLESAGGLLAWGLFFLAAGMTLSVMLRRTPAGIGHDVMAQTAFTAMSLGKVMIVVSIILLAGGNTRWVPTAAVLAVTVITYPVSASSLDRVLSPYAVAVTALVEILGHGARGMSQSLGLTLVFAIATALAGLLLVHRVPLALRPIGTAAIATMGTIICILASGQDAGAWASGQPLDPRPIEVLLTLALTVTIGWVAGGLGRLSQPPLAMAVAGVIALGFVGAPGISFALLVLIVGHALYDTPLRVAGILALPAFLVLWYYGRDMSFLQKSATLVGSGLLLLAGQALLVRAGWGREDTP